MRSPTIGRTFNLIVEDLAGVNQALDAGLYFYREIVQDGIALYEVPGHAFHPLKPLTPAEAFSLAALYYAKQSDTIETKLELASYAIGKGQEKDWPQTAAFNLHQAVEAAYVAVLLVTGLYAPRSHNIKFLRGLAEAKDTRLVPAWPRETRAVRKPFEKLKRAYVDARYNQESYLISTEELVDLNRTADGLYDLVRLVCEERLAEIRAVVTP